jgi:hypothetical protein
MLRSWLGHDFRNLLSWTFRYIRYKLRYMLRELSTRRRILLIGLGLVATGVACLYLSDAVARPGSWWQGTLDAFGVGFVIGGIVDAISLTLLGQFLAVSARQRERNDAEAEELIRNGFGPEEALEFITKQRPDLDGGPRRRWAALIYMQGRVESLLRSHAEALSPVNRRDLRRLHRRLNGWLDDTGYVRLSARERRLNRKLARQAARKPSFIGLAVPPVEHAEDPAQQQADLGDYQDGLEPSQ